jgi:hypothetical protein
MAGIVPFMAKHAGNAASGLTNIHTEQLAALRKKWGTDMLKTIVTHMTGVPEAMDAGWPVWSAYATPNVAKVKPMLQRACTELAARI